MVHIIFSSTNYYHFYDLIIIKPLNKISSKPIQNHTNEDFKLNKQSKTYKIFKRNPFFYESIQDLANDIRLKTFIQTNFNIFVSSKLINVKLFEDLDIEDSLYVATENCIEINNIIVRIENDKKDPEIFNSKYKSILDSKTYSLGLDNLLELSSFSNDNINLKSYLNPYFKYNNRKPSKGENRLVLKQFINPNPIRIKNSKIVPEIPLLLKFNRTIYQNKKCLSIFKDRYSKAVLKNEFPIFNQESLTNQSKDKNIHCFSSRMVYNSNSKTRINFHKSNERGKLRLKHDSKGNYSINKNNQLQKINSFDNRKTERKYFTDDKCLNRCNTIRSIKLQLSKEDREVDNSLKKIKPIIPFIQRKFLNSHIKKS